MGFFNFLSPARANQVSKEQNLPIESPAAAKDTAGSQEAPVTANTVTVPQSQRPTRRFSLRSLNFAQRDSEVHNTALPAIQEHDKRAEPSSSDKLAKNSALALRSLMVGSTSTVDPRKTPVISRPDLASIKSQLLEPNTANRVIAMLKELPASDDPSHAGKPGPIHAVSLAYTDAEMDALHFSKLISSGEIVDLALPSVISAPISKIAAVFKDMHVIDLINAPDFGLGQPGDGPGILAGALPTAETVLDGVQQITPELMALGFATGKAIVPNHSGIYPPTDRMSVLTYWWGLELLLPPPSLVYLGKAQSITDAVINFLSALALIDNGVGEILPFIHYIAQYVDFEFNTIKGQDKGKGVVCAATWILPVALVPQPWDFPTRPLSAKTQSAVISHDAAKVAPQDTPKVSPQDTAKVLNTSSTPPVENPKPPQSNDGPSHPISHDTKVPIDSSAKNLTETQSSAKALLGGS